MKSILDLIGELVVFVLQTLRLILVVWALATLLMVCIFPPIYVFFTISKNIFK